MRIMIAIFICYLFNIMRLLQSVNLYLTALQLDNPNQMPPKQIKAPLSDNPALEEEQLAIKLLYCVQKSSQAEQTKVKQKIHESLKTALFRVISAVEKVLKQSGHFEGSVSLLQDYRSVIDLIIQRTDIAIIRQFLHQFYEKDFSQIKDNKIVAFYNCLAKQMQVRKSKHLKMEFQSFNLNESQEKVEAGEQKLITQQPQNVEVAQQRPPNPILQVSDQCIEVNQIPQQQLSQESKELIRDFTAGHPSLGKGSHKLIKRLRMACLKPGQPSHNWQYYDSLQGGIIKLTFSSVRQQ